jgi:hypothetical protein
MGVSLKFVCVSRYRKLMSTMLKMSTIAAFVSLPHVQGAYSGWTECPDGGELFFSLYSDGAAKFFQIVNPTASEVSLDSYHIATCDGPSGGSCGSLTRLTWPTAGIKLSPGGKYTICKSASGFADTSECDETPSPTWDGVVFEAVSGGPGKVHTNSVLPSSPLSTH